MDEDYEHYDNRINGLINKKYGQKYYENLINLAQIKIEQSNSDEFKKAQEGFVKEWQLKLDKVNGEIAKLKEKGCNDGFSYLCPIPDDDWLLRGEDPPGHIEMPLGTIPPEDSVEAQWRKADGIYESEEQRKAFEGIPNPPSGGGIIWTEEEMHVTDPDPLLTPIEKQN